MEYVPKKHTLQKTWILRENIRCAGGGEIITDIKTRY